MKLKLEQEPFMMVGGMKTIMKLEDLTTINPLVDFLTGTQIVANPALMALHKNYPKIH